MSQEGEKEARELRGMADGEQSHHYLRDKIHSWT